MSSWLLAGAPEHPEDVLVQLEPDGVVAVDTSAAPGRARAHPGSRRWCLDRCDPAGRRGRSPGHRHQPRPGTPPPRRAAGRAPHRAVRRPAAGSCGRRPGDRRCGDLGPLVAGGTTGGRIIVDGATTGFDPPAELPYPFLRDVDVLGTFMGTVDQLRLLVALMVNTGVRPVIDSVRPLDEIHAVAQRMLDGSAFGKLVVELTT